MADDVIIKRISDEDADAMRRLYEMSLRINDKGFVQDLAYHGDIFARAQKYQRERGDMLGAHINGKLSGFGGLCKVNDDNVELGKLHLHPDFQGRGIGRTLAETLINRARELNYKIVSLHVTVTQNAAIGLYKRLGFIETHRRLCQVESESFDTIFMELPLV